MPLPEPTNQNLGANIGQPPIVGMVEPFEARMNQDLEWAMSEGSVFFEGRGKVQDSLRRVTKRLDEIGVSYAVAGGMALFLHGYHRFTEDVDILVTREGLQRIHEQLEGRGYVRRFEASKNLRDTESGVKIEFLLTGGFPGDGKPKEIAFPDPSAVAEVRNGIRVLNVPTLVTLKIASALTGVGRTKDLGDVEEMIKLLSLPKSFGDQLHPSIRDKYESIWSSINASPKRYVLLWKHESLKQQVASLDELINAMPSAASTLESMRKEGITLDPGLTTLESAYLVTTDRTVADKYQMEDESELLDRTR
ncbi:MAG: nucleotidyl transferase AbiEii/AbiGii toxin family protein [Planctomycetes bacterium]|nr:nucleotidyl transferase AbiEii/AbiGii toxin family protein [Planctomycetota bacterium]